MGAGQDRVVLLHGLGRTRLSMKIAGSRIEDAGYRALNIGYPSRSRKIEELAERVRSEIARRTTDGRGRVHFLTHSMGGIVVRALLAGDRSWIRLGRVVMLSPPNRGSRMARRVLDHGLAGVVLGPASRQLVAGPESLPSRLGPVDYDVGVIAGNRPFHPLTALLPGESDGVVGVEEARLEGMTDFLVVPRGHTFIMNGPEVVEQAVHFFRHGRFAKGA
jgi:pimeloyl-ACP methyl ester carboxylesterase